MVKIFRIPAISTAFFVTTLASDSHVDYNRRASVRGIAFARPLGKLATRCLHIKEQPTCFSLYERTRPSNGR